MHEVEAFIRSEAERRGINGDAAVAVANSEGSASDYARRGTFPTGSSWWPFQLHYGGAGYEYLGTAAGMGNTFTAKTGWQPGEVAAWRDSIRYALDHARLYGWGAWYGAAAIGIVGYHGIDLAVPWPGTPAGEWDYARRAVLTVTHEAVRLRGGPSTDAPILAEMAAGTQLVPLSDHAWRAVKLGDVTGWVAATYTAPARP